MALTKFLFAILACGIVAQDDEKKIDRLIEALDAETPQERERAQQALADAGTNAVSRLKAALPKATLEQQTRIKEALREIAFRVEESMLEIEGLPRRLARIVPGFRERLLSDDEASTRQVLNQVLEHGDSSLQLKLELGEDAAILKRVLERARGSELKLYAIRLSGRTQLSGIDEPLARLASDPDKAVRDAILAYADLIPLPGAERAFAACLKEGTADEKKKALHALEKMDTSAGLEVALTGLENESADIRCQATQMVALKSLRRVAPTLRSLLKDPVPKVRAGAIWALEYLDVTEVAEDILALHNDPDEAVRASVLSAIARWHIPEGKEIVLKALSLDRNAITFHAAMRAAGAIKSREAIPRLVAILKSDDEWKSQDAANALARFDLGEREKEVVEFGRSGDPKAKRRAIIALSGKPSVQAIAAFTAALSDPDVMVREAAIAGLQSARGPEARQAIRDALKTPVIRKGLLHALARSPERVDPALIIEFLSDSDPEVMEEAIEVVQRHGIYEAIPMLEKIAALDAISGALPKTVDAIHLIEGACSPPRFLKLLDSANERIHYRIWGYILERGDESVIEAAISRLEKEMDTRTDYLLPILLKHVSERSNKLLARLTESPEREVRIRATFALAKRNDERGLKLAREYLAGGDLYLTQRAAEVLIEAGHPDDQAIRIQVAAIRGAQPLQLNYYLRPLAQTRRPEAKEFLLARLTELGQLSVPDKEELTRWLPAYPRGTFDQGIHELVASPNGNARRGAAWALARLDLDDRRKVLTKLLKDGEGLVRAEAARALSRAKLERVPEELLACLADGSAEVRQAAVETLGKIDPMLLLDRIEKLLSDKSVVVREKLIEAIEKGKIRVPPSLLVKLLDDPGEKVRIGVARAIAALEYKECADRLVKSWKEDTSDWVRLDAAHALLRLGHEKGLEAGRGLVLPGRWHAAPASLELMRRCDTASIPAAVRYVAQEFGSYIEPHRTLFAMNCFTKPELYKKARETRVDLRGWRGTRREWIKKLSDALGLPFEVDPVLPASVLDQRINLDIEATIEEEISELGIDVNASCILEEDRVRVIHRFAAISHWERWYKENGK